MLNHWPRDLNIDLGSFLFGSVKLNKNADLSKYKYIGYGTEFGSRSVFSFTDGSMGKIVTIFGTDMSSSGHIDHKNKDILILGKAPTQGLDDTTLATKAKCSTNCIQPKKRFVLSLHYLLIKQKYIT